MSRNYEPSVYKHSRKFEKEVKPPKYYCSNCTKRCGDRCTFHSRPIDINYNKCFSHSYYSPIQAIFKAQADLEEVIKEEQERQIFKTNAK